LARLKSTTIWLVVVVVPDISSCARANTTDGLTAMTEAAAATLRNAAAEKIRNDFIIDSPVAE
jgi:hypothetical protein